MTIQDIDLKLKKLRQDYISFPLKRDIIVRQARSLEIAKEIIKKRDP